MFNKIAAMMALLRSFWGPGERRLPGPGGRPDYDRPARKSRTRKVFGTKPGTSARKFPKARKMAHESPFEQRCRQRRLQRLRLSRARKRARLAMAQEAR